MRHSQTACLHVLPSDVWKLLACDALHCTAVPPAPTCAGRAAQRMNAGDMQGIEPCTIHRLLAYQPRKAGGGGMADLDAATEEARLGSQGAFQYNR